MANSMSYSEKFDNGDTVNLFGQSKFSPFTTNSKHVYLKEFERFIHQHRREGGKFHSKFGLIHDMSTFNQALDVDGHLKGNAGVIGIDAKAKWCKEQTMAKHDIRLLIQANYAQNAIVYN